MDPATVPFLLDLNHHFYTQFGSSFAATRRRIQPGVRKILASLPDQSGDIWLDLGCGSGALAAEWLRSGRESAYLGMDFSRPLLDEARQVISGLPNHQNISFIQGSLAETGWSGALAGRAGKPFRGVLCFAVLHHLPSLALRERVLNQAASCLSPGSVFIHSVWQFQHSPKLMSRRVPWEQVGLDAARLEPGDTLLDWRAASTSPASQPALRYVHLFDPPELAALAQATGFEINETFESDGQLGRLGLYQIWIRKNT